MQPYQSDSYQTRFHSTVTKRRENWVRLQGTYFYPTSGGQLHDTGVLESPTTRALVTDVKLENGDIWHQLSGDMLERGTLAVGDTVVGTLDWERRYLHMQRHSAQHLLSQVFVQLGADFETRAVSLLGPVCTLDLAREPTPEEMALAEVLVNRTGYAALPIRAFEIDELELEHYPLRRPPKVKGRIRLVQMGDFELSACGGTHLRSTAEALPIKLLGQARVKGGLTRVRFVAGWEALGDYRSKHDTSAELALSFSAQPEEVLARVQGLRLEHRELKQLLRESRGRLVRVLASALTRENPEGLVVHILNEEDVDLLNPLAQELVQRESAVALLAAPTGERALLVFARHAGAQGDMLELLNTALAKLAGRGGGSPLRAQGEGDREGLEEVLKEAARSLELH